jgi:hypothetical protein
MPSHMCHAAHCNNYVNLDNDGVYINYRNEERMRFCCLSHAALILTTMAARKDYRSVVAAEYKRIQNSVNP